MPGPTDPFEFFDVPDIFATRVQRVETHEFFVRLIYTSRMGNDRRAVASIVMPKRAFNDSIRTFLEINGLPAN